MAKFLTHVPDIGIEDIMTLEENQAKEILESLLNDMKADAANAAQSTPPMGTSTPVKKEK